MFEKLEELAKNNKKISDFHLRAGAPLAYRQTGEIIKVQEVMVTAQDIKDLLSMNCNEHELNKFDKTHELDTSVTLIELIILTTFSVEALNTLSLFQLIKFGIPTADTIATIEITTSSSSKVKPLMF